MLLVADALLELALQEGRMPRQLRLRSADDGLELTLELTGREKPTKPEPGPITARLLARLTESWGVRPAGLHAQLPPAPR